MKVKTSELTGAALDWAVSKALGEYKPVPVPNYSTDWAQGGPIIEREGMTVSCRLINSYAMMNVGYLITQYGDTPLIAAMRCYVASKLGDEVELPEEVTP